MPSVVSNKLIVGRHGHGLLQHRLCGSQFAAANINHAKIAKRVKVVGIFRQDILILLFRRLIFALVEISPGDTRKILAVGVAFLLLVRFRAQGFAFASGLTAAAASTGRFFLKNETLR